MNGFNTIIDGSNFPINGCVGYWDFKLSGATMIPDLVGSGGTYNNLWNVGGVPNLTGATNRGAIQLQTGTNGHITGSTTMLQLQSNTSFSFMFWLKRGAARINGIDRIVTRQYGSGYNFYFSTPSGTKYNRVGFQFVGSSSTYLAADSATAYASTSTWYNIIWTYGGGRNVASCRLYMNGIAETLEATNNNMNTGDATNTGAFKVGTDAANQCNSIMDTMAVWNRVLSAAEALWLSKNTFYKWPKP